MANLDDFDPTVPLPPGLTIAAIRKSMEYIEREGSDLVDIYLEQRNIFSGVVGILGAKALDANSAYEKCRHNAIAQTRFPDLKRRGQPDPPPERYALESKASIRPWAVQAHYDHAGWYIIWRYLVDPTGSMDRRGRSVVVWCVHVVFATRQHWQYETSSARAGKGGRTHTYSLIRPAALLGDKAVYRRSGIVLSHGKPVLANGA